MSSRLSLARQSFRQRGVAGLFRDLRNFLAFNVMRASTDFTQHRYRLSNKLAQEHDFTVRYGPFAGMKLARESWWSAADHGAMILGLYEREVLDVLGAVDRRYDVLVDVGAADGYYAVGCLVSGRAQHAYCFEISATGRESIARNAALNGVADRVTVLGEAHPGFMNALRNNFHFDPSRAVVIMDIEGGEQQLLSPSDVASLANSVSIIELHDHALPDNFAWDLRANAVSVGLNMVELTTQARDPGSFLELARWTDDDRWILCSEGRPRLMRWAVLTPCADLSAD